MSYGYTRGNLQRKETPPPSLDIARSKGLGVEALGGGVFVIGNAILFWPATGFWKTKDDARKGYGIDSLMKAITPANA